MQGKVLGIPLVLLVLVLLTVGPLAAYDFHLSQQLSSLNKSVATVKSCTAVVTPDVSPSVSPSPKVLRGASSTSTESGAVK